MARSEYATAVEPEGVHESRLASEVANKVEKHLQRIRQAKGEDIKTTITYPTNLDGIQFAHVQTTAKITIVD